MKKLKQFRRDQQSCCRATPLWVVVKWKTRHRYIVAAVGRHENLGRCKARPPNSAALLLKVMFHPLLLQEWWDSSSMPSASCPSSPWRRWGTPVTSLCSTWPWPTSVSTSTDWRPPTPATSGMTLLSSACVFLTSQQRTSSIHLKETKKQSHSLTTQPLANC